MAFVEKRINNIVDWIKSYFINNGDKDTKAIIGISGGKDSTIAAALLVRALGPDKVIGVLMPNGEQKDIKDAEKVCEILKIKSYKINIENICKTLYADFTNESELSLNDVASINTPPRLRMTILYMIAGIVGGRVVNTSNASERYIGYCTKFGDTAGDFSIFKNYYVKDILEIGDALEELPYELVHKEPADGLTGKTDEEKIGFTYKVLDNFLINHTKCDFDTLYEITQRHLKNEHKSVIRLPAPVRVEEDERVAYEF